MNAVKATVYSIYMRNIAQEVRDAQRTVMHKFLPRGWDFVQHEESTNSHPAAMTVCVAENKNPITIFFDIDCIPLRDGVLELLAARAEIGMLCGAVQRANHIDNGGHLYVGPFCMAFSNEQYLKLGSPSFYEDSFSDVAERLSYRWQEREKPVYFLWPTNVTHPLWDLTGGRQFGLGTTYENMIYHEFCARVAQGNFIQKCYQVVNADAMAENG